MNLIILLVILKICEFFSLFPIEKKLNVIFEKVKFKILKFFSTIYLNINNKKFINDYNYNGISPFIFLNYLTLKFQLN